MAGKLIQFSCKPRNESAPQSWTICESGVCIGKQVKEEDKNQRGNKMKKRKNCNDNLTLLLFSTLDTNATLGAF